jgi:predicted amidohydrolase YtcJ
MPPPGAAEHARRAADGMAALHRLGITAVHAQRIKEATTARASGRDLLRLRAAGELHLRVACNVAAHEMVHLAGLGLRTGFGDDALRLGHVKVFADGSLGSRTAWLLAPFEQADAGRGRQLRRLGHAAGADGGRVSAATLAWASRSASTPSATAPTASCSTSSRSWRAARRRRCPIASSTCRFIDPADLPRLAQLGITASVQPIHAHR